MENKNYYKLPNDDRKKKRVSFSIVKADNIEDLERIRKERESDLDKFLEFRGKVNENINKKHILIDDNYQNRFSRSNPVNEVVNVENIFLKNHSPLNKPDVRLETFNDRLKNILNTNENIDNFSMTKSPVFSANSPLFSNENLENNIQNTNEQIFVQNNLENNNINNNEFSIIQNNLSLIGQNSNQNKRNTISYEQNVKPYYKKLLDLNNSKQSNNYDINNCRENFPNNVALAENNISNNAIKNTNENDFFSGNSEHFKQSQNDSHKNSIEIFNVFNFAQKVYEVIDNNLAINNNHKLYFYEFFFNNLISHVKQLESIYLDEPIFLLENKLQFFKMKNNFDSFINKIRIYIRNKKFNNYNKTQLDKFTKYKKFKKLEIIFKELKIFTQKRKNWIKIVNKEIKKSTLWNVLDSWKIYVNYKRIKYYLKKSKKQKIFNKFKQNLQNSKDLYKKSNWLKKILILKFTFDKLKLYPLKVKNTKYNNQLSKEFYRNLLLKKIFKIIYTCYENLLKYKNQKMQIFNQKTQNEYIKIKVSNTTRVVTNKNSDMFKKTTKSNIKII